jgi:hypothetical protein
VAVAVRACVRVVLSSAPSARTSARSRLYCGDPSAGGGPGRNWSALSSRNGFASLFPYCVAGLYVGGVGCHTPAAAGGGVNGALTEPGSRPSSARDARTACACWRPAATPAVSALPSGMRASVAVRAWSSSVLRAGASVTKVSCTAAATAASLYGAGAAGDRSTARVAAVQPIAQVRLFVTWVGAPAAAIVSAVTSYHSSATSVGGVVPAAGADTSVDRARADTAARASGLRMVVTTGS